MSIQDALQALSDAHGSKALAAAFGQLEGQVRSARRAARQQLGTLAQTFVEAMRFWDAQKADGVSKAERVAGLEKTLQAAWPQVREWKYLCARCADYGLVMTDCPGDATCGRDKAHLPHEVGTPCWCSAGQRYKQPAKSAADFADAGTGTRKPQRGFSRMGR